MAEPFDASIQGYRQRLAATKPTQEAMATARRVLLWLSEHAYYWPQEWATVGDPTAREAHEHLTWAANQCGDAAMLITSEEEEAARDAHNQQARGALEGEEGRCDAMR